MERFSYYNPPINRNQTPSKVLTLEDLRGLLVEGLKKETYNLRTLLEEGRVDEYKTSKQNLLPSVTFGGVFDYRNGDPVSLLENKRKSLETETDPQRVSRLQRDIKTLEGKKGLLSASGLIVIDIDHLSETELSLEELRSKFAQDRELGTRLIFVSPSGDGLKVVCKTSTQITGGETYKEVYNSLRHYINKTYSPGMEIVDRSGSDITRACFLCNDPEAILLDWKETFDPGRHPVPKERREYREVRLDSGMDNGDGIEEIVRRVEESGIDIAPTYADYIPLVYSFTALGERGRGLLHRVCRLSEKYNPENTDKDFNNCLRSGGSQDIGVFIQRVKDFGINVFDYNNRRGGLPYVPEYRVRRQAPREEALQLPEEETDIDKYLSIPDLSSLYSRKREGIVTRYIFEDEKEREPLVLRTGAMTLICGKSSHCKSKFLQNLALDIAKEPGEGDVLFFSYEEELADVLLQFANIDLNEIRLSKSGLKNTEVLKHYFKSGSLDKVQSLQIGTIKKKLEDFKEFYSSGKLRVFYSDLPSERLCNLIRGLSQRIKIRAVFVDYVQLLYREGNTRSRLEEIKAICNDLRKVSIDLDIPLVLATQLNRETPNPTGMSEDNIADSADLTRYANTIVCLWNSAFDNVKDKATYTDSPEYRKLSERGFYLGEKGRLYAKITKNRGGTPNIDTILDFTGDTGKILPLSPVEDDYLKEDDLPTFDF